MINMNEQGPKELDRDQVALNRFREVLGQIPIPSGEYMRDLISKGFVRLVTDENSLRILQKSQKSGGIGWCVCFDPKTHSVKTMVGIDPERFVTRGPLSLKGSIRDVLEKFEVVIKFAESRSFEWQFLEDSEVDTFLQEIQSGGGNKHVVFDLGNSPR